MDEEAATPIQPPDKPCGIIKEAIIIGQRRFGGVLFCLVVAKIRLTAGTESATHMCGMASEI